MSKEKLKTILINQEEKRWIRILDAIAAFAVGALFFVLPSNIESALLKFSFWGAILSIPILAYALFRTTNLSKIERLAILLLVVSSVFALMVASFESAKSTW